ncbi:polysaccharide deacetylase [Thermaerobacter marianensis DSM 12885]|uniref:Polysaccharide deacetylase n=1 Tax=Thermaerobacter marianensis (strain ATCC 700841 / DSM 12885 / JCM 10246 / 7p75a) TaxID=644966 RepID=E6SK26_THEM7|nr:polysaccharide deacetylase family protein [Thermaerobacter marianensis]ADU51167.1 polysaccharide deacetylase [Thermaerobacter marianensis DSM 12885]
MFITLSRAGRAWFVGAVGLVAVLALGWLARPWERAGPDRPAPRWEAQPVRAVTGPGAAVVRAGEAAGPRVALTFDVLDGDTVVLQVLDVLAWRRVPATFFVTAAWARGHPELLRRMVGAGHEVGLRQPPQAAARWWPGSAAGAGGRGRPAWGEDAVPPGRDAGMPVAGPQPFQGVEELARLTGRPVRYVRPAAVGFLDERGPGSDGGARGDEAPGARPAGDLLPVLWSLDLQDWMNPGVDYVAYRARAARPGDILLLQASDFARQTPRAVPRVLEALAARGLEPVTLSHLLGGEPVAPPSGP